MMQRVLASRHFLARMLALGTGAFLFYARPFPEESFFLHLISLRAPNAFVSFRWLYNVCLFTTPYLVYLAALSALYVATLKYRQRVSPGHLPPYPDPRKRDELFLVIGEVHDPRKPGPSQTPHWLTIPERGLFTGAVILGAVGSGKTATAMYPFAEQILAFKAADSRHRYLSPASSAWIHQPKIQRGVHRARPPRNRHDLSPPGFWRSRRFARV